MVRPLKKWSVVVPLVLSLGTPWALLQSVAWFGMLINFSRQTAFIQAVAMTFDGQHPCRLCHFVQKGQAEEREQNKNLPKHDDSLQLGLPPGIPPLFHPPAADCPTEALITPDTRTERPPTPPPRFA